MRQKKFLFCEQRTVNQLMIWCWNTYNSVSISWRGRYSGEAADDTQEVAIVEEHYIIDDSYEEYEMIQGQPNKKSKSDIIGVQR